MGISLPCSWDLWDAEIHASVVYHLLWGWFSLRPLSHCYARALDEKPGPKSWQQLQLNLLQPWAAFPGLTELAFWPHPYSYLRLDHSTTHLWLTLSAFQLSVWREGVGAHSWPIEMAWLQCLLLQKVFLDLLIPNSWAESHLLPPQPQWFLIEPSADGKGQQYEHFPQCSLLTTYTGLSRQFCGWWKVPGVRNQPRFHPPKLAWIHWAHSNPGSEVPLLPHFT